MKPARSSGSFAIIRGNAYAGRGLQNKQYVDARRGPRPSSGAGASRGRSGAWLADTEFADLPIQQRVSWCPTVPKWAGRGLQPKTLRGCEAANADSALQRPAWRACWIALGGLALFVRSRPQAAARAKGPVISCLMRCTVPVPTPSSRATLRMPLPVRN